MKNCFKVLSLVLALTLIMSTVAFANTTTNIMPEDYKGVVFYDDFSGYIDDVFVNDNYLTSTEKGLTVSITDDSQELLNGGQGKYAKVKYAITDESIAELTNFFRIKYTDGPVDKSGYTLGDFKKMQVSFDICSTDNTKGLSVQLWNNFGTADGKNEKETIVNLGGNGMLSFLNSDVKINYASYEWLSFDFYFEFTGTSGTYSAYLNGNPVVENVETNVLNKCVESIVLDRAGIKYGDAPLYFYVDNYRIAVDYNASADLEPADLNREIFYEDFTGGYTTTDFNVNGVNVTTVDSASATGLIGSEGKGEFIKIDFGTSDTTYFRMVYNEKSALDDSGYQLADLGKMQASFDICPTTTDVLYVLKFYDRFTDTSKGVVGDELIKFDNDGKIKFLNGKNYVDVTDYVANQWLSFDLFFDFTGTSGTYDAYINGQSVIKGAATTALTNCVEAFGSRTDTIHSTAYTYYLDNFRLATVAKVADVVTNPSNQAINIAPTQEIKAKIFYLADGFNANSMITFTDESSNSVPFNASVNDDLITIKPINMLNLNTSYTLTLKSSIPVADQTLGKDKVITFKTSAKDLHAGYTDVIADFDFENAGESITGTGSYTEETNTYYINNGKTVYISDMEEKSGEIGKVAKIASTDATKIGVSDYYLDKTPAYTRTKNTPSLVKLEVEMKKESGSGYIFVGTPLMEQTRSGNELLLWSSNGYFQLRRGKADGTSARDVNIGVNGSYPMKNWYKLTFYIDFYNKIYHFYIDDVYATTQMLPSVAENCRRFIVDTSGVAYVNNMKISTIPAYGANTVSEYTNAYGEKMLGYAYKNESETDATNAMLVIADYQGRKTMLQAVAGQTSIAAGATGLATVKNPGAKADGATRVVYLWNGFETLVPLIKPFEI